jgi:parallel beta-helix repeat protein
MSVKKPGATFALLFALSAAITRCVQASTITVAPSEIQSQIQASINNSQVGDTISFQEGTYNFSHLRLLPGRRYVGSTNRQTVIHGNGGHSLMDFYGTGLTVQRLTFDGGGLYLGGPVSDVKVQYNTFRNIPYGVNGQTEFSNWTSTVGVFIDTSASNSDISYNTFQSLSSQILYQSSDQNLGVSGIFAYGFSNTTITNNTFDTVNEGIKVFFDHADGKNVHVNNNTFTNVHRMAIEMQDGSASGLEVAYNIISKPLAPWKATFGISAAVNGSSNTTIHDNIIDDQLPSVCGPGCWVGIGLEVAGNSTTVINNTVRGYWAAGIAVGRSTNMLVEDNVICGPDMGNSYISNETSTHTGEVFLNNITSTATYCSK